MCYLQVPAVTAMITAYYFMEALLIFSSNNAPSLLSQRLYGREAMNEMWQLVSGVY